MAFAGGPSVWLEFSPLARICGAVNLGQGTVRRGDKMFEISSGVRSTGCMSRSFFVVRLVSLDRSGTVHCILGVYVECGAVPKLLLGSNEVISITNL